MKDSAYYAHDNLEYWINSSDDDYETMITLFENKKFNWALFVGHLVIEKLLKAIYYIKHKSTPPYIHNLLRLIELCELELTVEQKTFFATVTAFNINSRYDDYKMSFQKMCTYEFTSNWIEQIRINRIWMKKLLEE